MIFHFKPDLMWLKLFVENKNRTNITKLCDHMLGPNIGSTSNTGGVETWAATSSEASTSEEEETRQVCIYLILS